MAKIVSTAVTGPVHLAPTDSPLTVTGAGSVTSSGAGADGIDGPAGTVWIISNAGQVSAPGGSGVSLQNTGTVTNSNRISGSYAIDLLAGGTVNNRVGGTLSGSVTGVRVTGAQGNVSNAGSITGPGRYAVTLDRGGSVTNTGSVIGAEDGIRIQGATGVVKNSGTITGTRDDGVALFAGGQVTNNAGGSMSGLGVNGAGVFITGGTGTVVNSGAISGPNHIGVLLSSGTLTNNKLATISGVVSGVVVNAGLGSVTNAGTISSTATNGAGIDFETGGTVANRQGGAVSGGNFGVFITGGTGSVTNAGSIAGSRYDGVFLGRSGGSVTNTAGGAITGGSNGAYLALAGTVTNAGTLSGAGTGADLQGGGTVINSGTGLMSGQDFGVFVTGGSGSVTNSGVLKGNHAAGLLAGGSLANKAGGSLTGRSAGVFVQGGTATVTNAGSITASSGAGADLESGGSVTNAAGATISGSQYGVFLTNGSGTVSNAGTISGSIYAVRFADSGTNRLVVRPQAVFSGAVTGGANADSTLELAGGSGTVANLSGGAGTVTENGFTWSFLHFPTLAFDAGGNWTVTGSVAKLTDNGTVAVNGSLDVTGAIDPASTGLFNLNGGASLEVAAATGGGTRIGFAGSSLVVDSAAMFGSGVGTAAYSGPRLDAFKPGDTVDLRDFAFNSVAPPSYAAGSGLLQLSNGAGQNASLHFNNATLGGSQFVLASDGASGTDVTHV